MALHALLFTGFLWEHRKPLQPAPGVQHAVSLRGVAGVLCPVSYGTDCMMPGRPHSVQMRTAVANCPLSAGPSLKTLCKLAVIQYNLDQSCLPHDIRYCMPCWEVTPWVVPVLGVLQPWLRAAWGPPQHCAASGQAGLETTAEADVQRSCSSPGHCFRAFSQCIPLVCYRWELSAMTTNSTISRPIVSSQG